MREKRSLGEVEAFKGEMRPGDCRLLARLAERPAEPGLLADPGTVGLGETVNISVSAPGGCPRALHVQVADPSGLNLRCWDQAVLVEAGRENVTLHVPYNAAGGHYAVTARDVATGQEATTRFSVPASPDK